MKGGSQEDKSLKHTTNICCRTKSGSLRSDHRSKMLRKHLDFVSGCLTVSFLFLFFYSDIRNWNGLGAISNNFWCTIPWVNHIIFLFGTFGNQNFGEFVYRCILNDGYFSFE